MTSPWQCCHAAILVVALTSLTGAAPPTDELTPRQQADLDKLLRRWQRDTALVPDFRCQLEVWENNPVFNMQSRTRGHLTFQAPNMAAIRINEESIGGDSDQWRPYNGWNWACDGTSMFETRHAEKKVFQYPIPAARRGAPLELSPVPVLFHVNADELKRRYILRDVTTPDELKQGEHWLRAWPRDPSRYDTIEMILKYHHLPLGERLMLYGLRVIDRNGNTESTYLFRDYRRRNGVAPWIVQVPEGYEHVVDDLLPNLLYRLQADQAAETQNWWRQFFTGDP